MATTRRTSRRYRAREPGSPGVRGPGSLSQLAPARVVWIEMWGSAALYPGVTILACGLVLTIRPITRLRVGTRRRALAIASAGAVAAAAALFAPAFDTRVATVSTALDEFAPAWQFREVHTRRVGAPPERVFEALRQLRADDILLFRTLTWIRRGGRRLPPGVLNAGSDEPIIDVATKGGFVILAERPPRELVIGAIVAAPPGPRPPLTPGRFTQPLPPGSAIAAMNFLVMADGTGASIVSTETRVFANSPHVRRRFAAYWRAIYPGSTLIRRMWLRAIDRRATA